MFTERGSDETSSNLRNFLVGITPIVQMRYLPRKCVKHLNGLWNPWVTEAVEYFHLADLWSSYDEWSAYGAGTRIKLDDEQTVVQYYVPYLSAIQIFTSNRPIASYREEDDYDDCSLEDSMSDQECHWHPTNRLGHLYFQYFERASPYQRVPLVDKINSFTEKFPGLMSLKSIDLSPASWMSVAWYPIYHIPTRRTIKDLSASFLTYHTLSSSFLDMGFEEGMGIAERKGKKRKGIAFPPFGLATYKMHGDVWLSDQTGRNRENLVSLLSAADSWLKQLRVQQHDFNYFTTKRYR